MITAQVKAKLNAKTLARKAWRSTASPLQQAASMVARSAKASIKVTQQDAAPTDQAPHTRGKGKSLKKAIRYHVDKQAGQALIGPAASGTGITGHYHEFGGVQMLRGKRRRYKLGGIGPIDERQDYETPQGKLRARVPGAENIAFARLKTPRMVMRAYLLDREIWGDVETPSPRIYPKRPFMWPAVIKNQQQLIKLFTNFIK
jgi:hypothetical protein